MRIFINGHSIYDEAAFYELYVSGQISSKQGLDHYLKGLIPGFTGNTIKNRL